MSWRNPQVVGKVAGVEIVAELGDGLGHDVLVSVLLTQDYEPHHPPGYPFRIAHGVPLVPAGVVLELVKPEAAALVAAGAATMADGRRSRRPPATRLHPLGRRSYLGFSPIRSTRLRSSCPGSAVSPIRRPTSSRPGRSCASAPLPFLPAEWHGKKVLIFAACYSSDMAEGEKVTKALRALGNPIVDVISPHPFVGWQAAFDPLLTPGARNYWKSHDFADLSDGAIGAMLSAVRALPSPECEVFIAHVGGAMAPFRPTPRPGRTARPIS